VTRTAAARGWFAATAAAVFGGLALQLMVTADATGGFFDSSAERVLNVFCFFTIQSNVLVGIACALLALDPARSSTAFAVLRLSSVVAIVVTGIVYHTLLGDLFELGRLARVADDTLHTVTPVMAVVGWLAFGPRGRTSARIAALSAVFPVCWMVFTLIRGELVGFYPYPFVDVHELGYAGVAVRSVVIAVLYLGLAAGAVALDRRLARRRGQRAEVA
jgi:hypothetical protein